jgi:hypothetical protein
MEEMASNICKHGASTASSVRIKALQLFGSDCKFSAHNVYYTAELSTELPGYRPSSGHYVKRGPAVKNKGICFAPKAGRHMVGDEYGSCGSARVPFFSLRGVI